MSQVFPFHFYSVYKGFYNQLNISQLSQKKKKKKKITFIKLTATSKYHDQNDIFAIFKLFEVCTYNLTLLIYSFYVLFVNATNN